MENVKAQTAEEKKVYAPVADQWGFEDAEDEAMGVETIRYANGGISKRCTLSDGRVAVAHRLKGKDSINIQRITGGNSVKVQDAVAALSTKIDDKPIVMEDLDNLWYNDYTKVTIISSSINFM